MENYLCIHVLWARARVQRIFWQIMLHASYNFSFIVIPLYLRERSLRGIAKLEWEISLIDFNLLQSDSHKMQDYDIFIVSGLRII